MTAPKQYSLVMIAGDSGDGIQLAGQQLSYAHAHFGHIVQTMADFPAEIRAPAGTIYGVSGFQLCFSSDARGTTGEVCDYLVVFNPAAYAVARRYTSEQTWIIFDRAKWSEKDWQKAGFTQDPLEGRPHTMGLPLTEISRNATPELTAAQAKRNRNLVALGLILWIHDLPLEPAQQWLQARFADQKPRLSTMLLAQKAGYFLGETLEWPAPRLSLSPAQQKPGRYIQVTGNQALVLGMAAAADFFGKQVLLCGYPITPASELLHHAAQWQHQSGVRCVQAEDEIAAAGVALGASYGGHIGVCCTSGPGMDLKAEMIGLACMAEIPLVVIDVQRAGPSTGMPTKAEQTDLLMVLFGRHGECPVPVLAQNSPDAGVQVMQQAIRWAQQAQTPVIVLSDALMAQASAALRWDEDAVLTAGAAQPQRLPLAPDFEPPGLTAPMRTLTGLETQFETGEISYDPANHDAQVTRRKRKIEGLSEKIEEPPDAQLLLISYGSVASGISEFLHRHPQWDIAHLDLSMLYPLPQNFWEILQRYPKVLAIDLAREQLAQYLRSYGKHPIEAYGQIHGHHVNWEKFAQWLCEQHWFQRVKGEDHA